MDWESLGPLGVFLGVIGGGVAWIYDRWTARADKREAAMIDSLKTQLAEAISERDEARKEAALWELRGTSWWRQLVKAGIDPDPTWGDGSE